MKDKIHEVRAFRYPRYSFLCRLFVSATVTMIVLTIPVLSLVLGQEFSVLGFLLVVFCGGSLGLATLLAFLSNAEVRISDKGIGSYQFGLRTKFLCWNSITKIEKVRVVERNKKGYSDHYILYSAPTSLMSMFVNWVGPLSFWDKIVGLDALISEVMLRAKEEKIPLFVRDGVAARNRAARGEVSLYKALDESVRVEEFVL